MMTTDLQPNEIVRAVKIPLRGGRSGSAYLKMAQKASGFAICGAAAVVELDGSGALSHVAVGITGVANRAFRATETEKALRGKVPSADLLRTACQSAAQGVVALDDIHASADYRLDLARIFARRALGKAIERAST
jgi:carbon-monoxide dehydrogenase medium subunit